MIAVAEKEGIEPDTSLYDIFETIANERESDDGVLRRTVPGYGKESKR